MTWQLIVSFVTIAITLIGIGVSIGLMRSKYVTKDECLKSHTMADDAHRIVHDRWEKETMEHRKAVWEKIDQMYEWMITGVIQIRRSDK